MTWLFRVLDRTSRLPALGAILLALLAFRIAMQATLKRLREVSGQSILDYELFYSRDRVTEILGHYGREGFALYRRFMLYDLAFPLLYGVFFASLLHLVLARTRLRWLALAPLAMALLDYVENVFFHGFLKAYPHISDTAIVVANVFSTGKFGFGAVTAIAALVAAFVFIRSRIKPA